jgi:xanthine dehydrogenase YagS FAD-binding subunit
VRDGALHLGALETMADVAANADVVRGWPVIAQALALSASPQIRNMGTMGGNLLQRTRCSYFRDTGFSCNKRAPGSGCPAIAGDNRELAILGGSESCIATHPSDFPVALMALSAKVAVRNAGGENPMIDLADFYRLPGNTPHVETALQPGDLITEIIVPSAPVSRRSAYLKIRDRTSFAFALVSVAVALDVADGTIRDARIALGGVAPMPWRAHAAEAALRGKPANSAMFEAAARLATEHAHPASMNGFKVELVQRAVHRALGDLVKTESL